MIYKKHNILPVYDLGPDYRGTDVICYFVSRRIDGVEIGRELTIEECKALIRKSVQMDKLHAKSA